MRKQSIELTHDLNFQCSACAVTLCVACHAGVRCLVAHSFNVLDDECAVGEDLLLSVDRQDPGVSFPDDALDRVSADGAGDAQGFSSNDGLFVHVANERQTVNVETRRMLGRSDLRQNIALRIALGTFFEDLLNLHC